MSGMYAAALNVDAAKVMSLRRPLIISVVVGLVGFVVSVVLGHPVMGILGCVGLGLGLFNYRLMQRSVVRAISEENPTRKALTLSSAQRLLFITLLAVAFGIFLRPDGLGVFIGLAVFQVISVTDTLVPVLKGRHENE